ncbi:protein lifeguard 1-like isoform X1 [Daphnia pulicaria]|uniref:protein lifeguard 1-like isoform X1 n=2 Tax=Daphnia pulicaria TaxID=35523 RepID=UPI001EECAA8B|nr:protein lifeguard 1-like isoform X1 [Daphnia pulicaria]
MTTRPKQPTSYPHQSTDTIHTAPSSDTNMYGGMNHFDESGSFDDSSRFSFSEKSIRLAFVRKVYAILMAQLTITMGFIALFVFVPSVASFSQDHGEIMWIAFSMSIVLLIVLACCSDFRRRFPLNIILLGLFTICEGIMLGAIASFYESEEVLIAAGICAAVCLSITIFSLQTKWDITSSGVCKGFLFVSLIVLLMFGIMAICMQDKVVNLVYASLGALVFSIYLVFDTQLMLGGKHRYSISPEEYVFAALNLYLDIVNIFIYILAIVGGSSR